MLTTEQQEKLWQVWNRGQWKNKPTFAQFFMQASKSQLIGGEGCILVQYAGMWLGIETDGYAHT